MAINVLYFGGTAPASASGGGGGTIQTIIKRGVLTSFPRTVEIDGVIVRSFFQNTAKFSQATPTDYELYYNGQWYAKGQLGESVDYVVLGTDTVFAFPENLVWQPNDILELKYQIIVP